jgi:trigger factor
MPIDSDMVVLDYQIFEGEEQFIEPVVGETYVLGESQLFDALADAIRLMMLGTTAELTLAFDEDDLSAAPHVRGKELRYVVTLKEHKRRVLPDADAELAKQANPEFETFDQMLEQIRTDLLRNKALQARSEVVTDVINAMAETSAIEVPRALVEREIDDEITQVRSRLAQQRMTLEEYLDGNGQTQEAFREEIAPNAERRVRNSIVLQEIAKAEGFEVSEEDISGEIDRMTVGSQNPERLRAIYESDHFRGLLESEMFDRKLQELVVGIATEGRGAVTGPGAEALKAELEPPTPAEPATVVEVEGEPVDDESAAGDEDITIIEFAGEDLEAAPEPDAAQDAEAADSVDSERRDEADVEATSVSLAEQDAEQAKPG